MHEYVLVAEDDEDVALLITQMLKNEGYCYHWAENGKEAMETIARKQPQLIITDIMMPQMDGIELIKNIRADENTNHIPIIVVSARTENNDRLIGLDAGAEVLGEEALDFRVRNGNGYFRLSMVTGKLV